MKKLFALFVCIALIASCLTVFAACKSDVDMSLRSDTLYGLYWYGEDADDSMKSQENMPTEYYDPEKPTLIYSHGWKPAGETVETMRTLAKTVSKTAGASGDIDYVKELKALGYNVAFWNWHEYAQNLDNLHNEIWTVKTVSEVSGKDDNYVAAIEALDGRTFAGEFARSVCAVMKDATDQEVIFVGHSFGGEMVTAAAYTLYKLAESGVIVNKNILPDRISLADPYIPAASLSGKMDMTGEDITGYVADAFANALEFINGKGGVIDLNGAMNGLTYNGYLAIKEADVKEEIDAKIKANTVYVIQKALTSAYGAVGDVHNVSRDYILTSFIEGKKGNMDACVPRVSMTAEELREYVGRQFELTGKGFLIADAVMKETTAG